MELIEVLTELGIPFRRAGEHHHVRGSFLGVDCPLCSANSGGFKLGLNPPVATCWQCGKQNLAWMLHLSSGVSYAKIAEMIRGVIRYSSPKVKPRGKLVLPDGIAPMLKCHRRYLSSRNINPEEAESVWGVQGIGLVKDLAWRLFIPITLQGKTVSWTTRAIGSGLRYIAAAADCEAIPRNELLFGEDHAHHSVIVVEGPLDAIRIGCGAVATMGLKFSSQQVMRLSRFPLRYVCFDNERAAQKRAAKLCGDLSCFPGVTRQVQIDAKDPGEASEREIQQLRRLLV